MSLNPTLPSWKRLLRRIPHPLGGSWLWNLLYVFFLVLVQDFLIPQIFKQSFFLDLLTPWMLMLFVFQIPVKAVSLAWITVLLLETHSGLPKGLLLASYWLLGVLVFALRQNLSWTSMGTWAFVFFLGLSYVQLVKLLAYGSLSLYEIGSVHLLTSGYTILFSWILGMLMISGFRLNTLEAQRLVRDH